MSAEQLRASAAIFDLDGTLLDTLGDLADAVNAAMLKHGFAEHSEEAVRRFIGNGASTLIRRAVPESVRDDDGVHAACLATFHEIYGDNYANRTRPYDGIKELIGALRNQGVPLGILSNKPHDFTKLCSEAYFKGEIDVVLGQRDSVPKKPDPAGAIEIAQLLGVAPAQCAYIGDSEVDIQTAQAAGMMAIGVSWGFRPLEELEAENPDKIINTPTEILGLFPN